MQDDSISYKEDRNIPLTQIRQLYEANKWSSANRPQQLHDGLMNSHALVSAWHDTKLVGLANAISDGHLVVYYPHALVLPDYRQRGIGANLMTILAEKYAGFHQHVLIADRAAIGFYEKCGFRRAGQTEPMWIYQGNDH